MDKQIRELKNPLYSNVFPTNNNQDRLTEIDDILTRESKSNQKLPWNKLDKTAKIQRLSLYADNYCEQESLSPNYRRELKKYFTECLERKKLQNSKEIIYDKEVGIIKNIPSLFYNKTSQKFTLKLVEKKTTKTSKLPKIQKRVNKIEIDKT
jgi:hypothetical protein